MFVDPSDVVGYNYQPHRYAYDQEHFPDRVICGTESYPHQAFVVWEATLCFPTVIGDFV
jgi:beta-galactosidase